MYISGVDPGLRRAEGCAKIFGVFRMKKSRFYAKKIIFFPILGGVGGAPLWTRPCIYIQGYGTNNEEYCPEQYVIQQYDILLGTTFLNISAITLYYIQYHMFQSVTLSFHHISLQHVFNNYAILFISCLMSMGIYILYTFVRRSM